MGFDAKMEGYDLVEVDGRVCLFSYMRLDRNSVPEGIFCYEVEDSEREDCSFGKIKERVEHRRMGSILCREKLPIGADGEYHPENPVKMAGDRIKAVAREKIKSGQEWILYEKRKGQGEIFYGIPVFTAALQRNADDSG